MTAIRLGPAAKQGLYDPQFEHDACGVGFIVDIKGRKSNAVVKQGIQILKNLDHRGASGSEVNTGDGAGILMQMPHAFLKKVAKKDARINLPEPGLYAAGNIFMPRNATQRRKIEEVFARVVQAEGQVYLGARSVPTDNSIAGRNRQGVGAVRAPGVHRPRAGDARRGGVRAQALRDPQARLQRDPRVDDRRRGVLVHRVACRTRRWSTRAC